MLLKPVSILLLFSLLSANCTGLFVFLGFEANQDYISKELCENKSKPELLCNGKCYLKKQLKQEEEKEQKQERQSQKTQIQDVLVVKPLVFKQYAFAEIILHVPLSTGMPQSIKESIFHPPQEN